MPEYYARIEAVNLDYSVYDTDNISTIRGGSFMVLDAYKGLEKKVQGITELSKNASEYICTFHAQNQRYAEKTVQKLLKEIPASAKSVATFVSGIIEKTTDETQFHELIETLKFQNRIQQYQKLSFTIPEAVSRATDECELFECELDGLRPATSQVAGGRNVSEEVKIRFQEGRKLKNELYKDLLGKSWKSNFQDLGISAATFTKGPFFSKDLEELSTNPKMGKLSGKIAFIHLDGNRFGKIRAAVSENEKEFKRFQKHIQENIRKPALKAILENAASDPDFKTRKGAIALETLLWGGDEVEWVVPAWQALNVLETFFGQAANNQVFTTSGDQFYLTHAAGVVFCHHNLPILQVREYANRLCDLAKNKVQRDPNNIDDTANVFSFLNMTAFDLIKGDFDKFLKDYHKPAGINNFIIKTKALPRLKQNLISLNRLLPRNKIYELCRVIKSKNLEDVKDVWDRILKLYPSRKHSLEKVIEEFDIIEQSDWPKFLAIADLIEYVKEPS